MALRVSSLNGVKVYNCSAGKTTPQWFEEALAKGKNKSLRYNEDFRRRIELIQDFTFPQASNRIKLSQDGAYVAVTGVYAPQVKVFQLDQLAMKFERHMDSECVQFQFLTENFRKMIFLRADRTIEIHAQFGLHHKVRIPRFGRDLMYDAASCDAYIAAAGPEVYRLNLDQGRFLAPLVTSSPSLSCCTSNPVHGLMAFGGDDGIVECWDPRDRTCVGKLHIAQTLTGVDNRLSSTLLASPPEISALGYDTDGLTMGVGLSTGHVLLYDLRTSHPLIVKDHRYTLPIINIQFHHKYVVSTDKQAIKIWDRHKGDAFTSIEGSAPFNDVCIVPDTGLIMAAGEQHRVQTYYIPQLGPAPKWCAFLDSITEEMEEQNETSIYDDYKFVTRQELESWGLDHLIGSNLLRAYMHGFFMDMRLYQRVRAVAEPDAYEKYVKQKVEEKIKKKTEGRIVMKKNLPAVNTDFARALLQQPSVKRKLRDAAAAGETEQVLANPLNDPRFANMFSSEAFAIDTSSEEFKRVNPAGNANLSRAKRKSDDSDDEDEEIDTRFDKVSDEEEDEVMSDEDEDMVYKKQPGKAHKFAIGQLPQTKKQRTDDTGPTDPANSRKQPAMYELKSEYGMGHVMETVTSRTNHERTKKMMNLTLEQRLRFEEQERALQQAAALEQKRRQAREEANEKEAHGRGGRRGTGDLFNDNDDSGRGRGRGRGRGGAGRGRRGGRGGGGARGGGGRGRGRGQGGSR